ncbi:helix-turn-helix domain-containing protein [Alterisphingorhabdus coralli]|uniref:Helix-turn-helix transcriptional regulator n=1 Tax=Alterisphingorhabdus coralli TaxID=3071408 RepID=A0AA97HZN1_9SPHN|nr:helix-turn-helix transcriptional regulator [Parasphingorhabdus sp. SCSIO 66989]WOE74899.1 helix-turn-helix transcriptional regulator [Parasphingorhabdus sp. SCSIO 66989]
MIMAHSNNQDERLIFAEEALVVEAQGLLQELLNEKDMTRADLARAMGVSRSRVTQLFSDECKNFTIRLWARALFALGEEAVVSYVGSEDCLEHYLAGRSEFPETEGSKRPGEWCELQALDLSEDAVHANDNVFLSLAATRDVNARYGVAA